MRQVLSVLLGILMVPTVCFAGDIQTDGKLKSTLPSGAPLEVASADMVVNLNADKVDGIHGTDIYTKAEVDALVAAATASLGRKRFYVTDPGVLYAGDSALNACASGFHMANFYEMSDPSSLTYAYDVSNAWTRADSGMGPPTCAEGWVRTGFDSATDDVPGRLNCGVWTSSEQDHAGTIVKLPCNFMNPTESGTYIDIKETVWVTLHEWCATGKQVWCVED